MRFLISIIILLFLGGCVSNPAKNGGIGVRSVTVKKYKNGSSFLAKFGERCYFITAHHNDPKARDFIKYPNQDIMIKKTHCLGIEQKLINVSVEPGDEILLVGYPKGRRGDRPTITKTKIKKNIVATYKINKNIYNTITMATENSGLHREGSSGGMACRITPNGCKPFGVIVAVDKKKREGGIKRMYISPLKKIFEK